MYISLSPRNEPANPLPNNENDEKSPKATENSSKIFNADWLNLPYSQVEIRNKIVKAISANKVFMVSGSRSVKRALLQRGWLEKKFSAKREPEYLYPDEILGKVEEYFLQPHDELVLDDLTNDFCDQVLTNVIPMFCWNCLPNMKLSELKRPVLVNRIGSKFTNKEILTTNLNDICRGSNVYNVQFPRSYSSTDEDQMADFIDNFRLIACMSVLKYFIYKMEKESINTICQETGDLSEKFICFAHARLVEYIRFKKHEDIDLELIHVEDEDWHIFLDQAYLFIHQGRKIQTKFKQEVLNLLPVSHRVLQSIDKYYPTHYMEGMHNVWLLKPGFGSRGRNIHVTGNYMDILGPIQRTGNIYRWVIQKYIEKPLLIHNTKFDIRVWFIIKPAPLEIWVYKDCYLRFCSRTYNLRNYHESIHLANHCIQRKYKNDFVHPDLPQNNMWHSNSLQAFLNMNGHLNKWGTQIFPGICHSIIGAILSVEPNIRPRRNSFQLYGADFLIDERCMPWLLEINSSPDMSHSTSITASLVPRCIEDLVKVTVDINDNPNASPGRFTCVFNENVIIERVSHVPPTELIITGTQIRKRINEKPNDVYTKSGVMVRSNRCAKSPRPSNSSTKPTVVLHRAKNTTFIKWHPEIERRRSIFRDSSTSRESSSLEVSLLKNHVLAADYLNMSADCANEDSDTKQTGTIHTGMISKSCDQVKSFVTLFANFKWVNEALPENRVKKNFTKPCKNPLRRNHSKKSRSPKRSQSRSPKRSDMEDERVIKSNHPTACKTSAPENETTESPKRNIRRKTSAPENETIESPRNKTTRKTYYPTTTVALEPTGEVQIKHRERFMKLSEWGSHSSRRAMFDNTVDTGRKSTSRFGNKYEGDRTSLNEVKSIRQLENERGDQTTKHHSMAKLFSKISLSKNLNSLYHPSAIVNDAKRDSNDIRSHYSKIVLARSPSQRKTAIDRKLIIENFSFSSSQLIQQQQSYAKQNNQFSNVNFQTNVKCN